MVTSETGNAAESASTQEPVRQNPDSPEMQRRPFLSTLGTIGDISWFGVSAIASMPIALRYYFSEVVRQAGIVILSSALVLWAFTMIIGLEAALVGSYILSGLGAGDYIGLFTAVAAIQAVSAPTFGWVFAAKVGCGFAAELGTMRITEEIDALSVMGLRPKAYLVGTRLLAFLIATPFLWLVSTGFMMIGSWIMARPVLQTASPGGYSDVFWSFQTPLGLIYALIWAVITCLAIVIVSCYFGYTASGGPVGVGQNTARSMGVNMVLVSVFTGVLYQLFFGVSVQLPIAN